MAIVKFSLDFLRGTNASLQGYMVNYANGSVILRDAAGASLGFFSAGGFNSYGSPSNIGLLRIMSGTRPTNIEILTSTTAPAGTTVLWQAYATSANWAPSGNNWYADPTVLSSIFVPTVANGVASWFWLCTATAYVPADGGTQIFPNPSPIYHNITGDVGLVGSGSDMEMLNTTISTGQFVRVVNINIGMPIDAY